MWRRKWQSTPGLLPGKSHGQRSLVSYSPWGRKESDMTERLHFTLQIITTMRYHLTLVRMAIIKKSTNDKCWRGCGAKGTLLHCWWEYKLIQPLWKMVWRFLKKLGMKAPYDPAVPLLGKYSEETKVEKDTCIPLFTAALFTIVRTWKQPRCSLTDDWIKKL